MICYFTRQVFRSLSEYQGSFVSDKEVQKVVDYLIEHNGNASYSEEVEEHVNANAGAPAAGGMMPGAAGGRQRQGYIFRGGRKADHR